MTEWQDTSRPETADLHRRIVAAAIRNGHSERSFLLICLRHRLGELENRRPWCVFIKGEPVFNWFMSPTNDTQSKTLARAV